MPHSRLLLAALLGLATACSKAPPAPQQAVQIPAETAAEIAPAGRVTDAAGVLTADEESALAARLARLEDQTGHQMVIVTLPSLGGRDVADVARDLGNRWGVGRKGLNDGVVLLVAPNERRARIAVGYGLEARLTNADAQRFMDDHIIPHFRERQLHAGIAAGTEALIAALTSPMAQPEPPRAGAGLNP